MRHDKLGIKAKAKKSLRQFIVSFSGNMEEMRQWVWAYLDDYEVSRFSWMRYEIFVDLVFPVLLEGYHEKDFKSTMWLGLLINNLMQAQSLYEKIDYRDDFDLLEECYIREPENRKVIDVLFFRIIKLLEYCEHEWPNGIPYHSIGATLEQCDKLRHYLELAREMDKESKNIEFLEQFENRLEQYEIRMKKYMASLKQ
ncbi:MAG: hypothetical protein AB9903_31615 [Vulcanimicrobiota bacterium]